MATSFSCLQSPRQEIEEEEVVEKQEVSKEWASEQFFDFLRSIPDALKDMGAIEDEVSSALVRKLLAVIKLIENHHDMHGRNIDIFLRGL